jgi:hypothetical protein
MRFGIGSISMTLLLLLGVRGIPKELLMLEGKKGVHTWMILMMTTMMSSKMKIIELSTVRAGSCQGEEGVVEVSEEIRDGKMGLTETLETSK